MFSFGNFVKFLIVLFLAGSSTQIPVIGDIGKLVGSGVSGSIIGFLVLFIFWWFVVSQILSFLSFAFGGGVGRYHTTKLYRRLQWVTFTLFTCIPLWIVSFLLLNLTFFSVDTKDYRDRYKEVQKERIRAAKATQQNQIAAAKQERLEKIAQARSERRQKIAIANNERDRKIRLAKRKRQLAIQKVEDVRNRKIAKLQAIRQRKIDIANQKRQVVQSKIDRDKRLLRQARDARQSKISDARKARRAKIERKQSERQIAFQTALNKRQAKIDDEWKLIEQQRDRILKPEKRALNTYRARYQNFNGFLMRRRKIKHVTSFISGIALRMARARGMTIGYSFNNRLLNEIYDYKNFRKWRDRRCVNLDAQSTLICDLIKEIILVGNRRRSRIILNRGAEAASVIGLYRQLVEMGKAVARLENAEIKVKEIEAFYEAEYKKIAAKYRKPKLSDFPEVDLSQFPQIEESDFPKVDESKYPLAKKPDLPKVDLSKFPPIDMRRFPPINIAKFPPVDMRKFPPVEGKFPRIKDSRFPKVDPYDFPLKVDNSPIGVSGNSYVDRLSPTFSWHFWWFLPAVLTGWIIFLKKARLQIAAIYGRIMRFLDEGRFGYGGSARFAGMLEEWSKTYKSGTLYMGRSLFNPFDEVGLGGEAHMLTVAGSRGGKGTTSIIPNLLLWEGSAVVIDPKGTNAHVTANARRAMGQDVHIIDPFGIVTDKTARFDPLENVDPDSSLLRERIASIADALVIPDNNAKETHWDDGARTIISGLISHIMTQETENKKLYEIRDLLSQLPEDQDKLWAAMAFNEGGGNYAKDAAMRYIRGSQTNEILSIMSNADKHTEWLSSPVMRHIISEPTLKISDIKKRPTTIYLVIPPRQLERQNRILRLFINLVIDAMEDGGRSKVPVLMIMDEFLALGKMPEISNAFATMASYNLILWPFVQELEKLEKLYEGSFNSFIANSRAIQAFAVSDAKTKDYISERLGNRPISGLGNIAKSNDNLPLRAPNDVELDIAAAERRQYIIEAGKPAMLLEKVPYYDSSPSKLLKYKGRFEERYDADPDFKEG